MGTFVNQTSVNPEAYIPNTPPKIHEEGNWSSDFTLDSPWALVNARFEQSLSTAEDMLNRLVGGGTYTGYLPELQSIIEEFPATGIANITYDNVTVGDDVGTTVLAPPTFAGTLDLDFGTFDKTAPVLASIPTVDLSSLFDATLPDEISNAISWFELAHDTTLYTALFNRLITDLQAGTTGLDADVEQAIFDRAQARQDIEEDKIQTEIEEYFASTGFSLPTGAMASRLQEHANGRAMRVLDMNQKIMIEQAELAQKNSQFAIESARTLEGLLLDYDAKKNDRALDYSKAVAANAIAIYAEGIKAFIAKLEANKNAVQIQVENLRAVVESNKGLIEAFSSEAQVFGIVVDAKAKVNTAITDVYKAEMVGYDSQTKAISENQKNLISAYELRMKDARNDLDAAIAAADTEVKGYTSEYQLRSDVAKAMANIAMQAMASAYGAVNSSAGVGYNGSESRGETWSHGESRSDNYTHSESISGSISIAESLTNTLNESHGYTEK